MPKPKNFEPFKPLYAGHTDPDKPYSFSERKKQIERVKAERRDILKQMPK